MNIDLILILAMIGSQVGVLLVISLILKEIKDKVNYLRFKEKQLSSDVQLLEELISKVIKKI